MTDIWLMLHTAGCESALRRVVRASAPEAHFVDVGDLEGLLVVSGALRAEGFSVAIGTAGTQKQIEGAVRCAAGLEAVREVAVVLEEPDPASSARWFYAGATQVITAGDVGEEPAAEEYARIGEDAFDTHDVAVLADGDKNAGARERGRDPSGAYADEMTEAQITCSDAPPWEDDPARDCALATPRAPVVSVVAGRGASGKTTLVAYLAACAARSGMRVAVVDCDLMLGNLPELFGVEGFVGLEELCGQPGNERLEESLVEQTAIKIGPGLTLWGPCGHPEMVELVSKPLEELLGTLRSVADVVLVDTPGFWGDAVAMVVSQCDRCLVVGTGGPGASAGSRRVVELARMLGVPATKMTSVYNRFGAKGCDEGNALAFELGCSLASKIRIADGGDDVAAAEGFTSIDDLAGGDSTFALSLRAAAYQIFGELGCPVSVLGRMLERDEREREKHRFKLPWTQKGVEAA